MQKPWDTLYSGLFQYKCDTSNIHNLKVLISNMLLVFRLIDIQGHNRSSQGRTFPKFCFFFVTHCILSPFEIYSEIKAY